MSVLALCEAGGLKLISSEILLFETRQNPNVSRKEHALEVLGRAKTFVHVNEEIENRANEFTALGIKPLDALHLASAEHAQADYCCTCDDMFLKKAKSRTDLRTRVVSPIQLIEEVAP
ncbi:MAG: PIN domain-containing protein [candidate division KSB1 bacterium]|nr:PIN domain-containing protein [candidate division KSB1 bacterium]MDZ7302804.1 PIN domain-containing protein [candidate division KSB1 bacterium]MDZ7311821.1 PIN domain-containing protein [candidate division KSB1 bacterium]